MSNERGLSIERLAELLAKLEDPFAQRSLLLRAAGLDEVAWDRVHQAWRARLEAGGSDNVVLAARFCGAFERTREELASARRGEGSEEPPSDPRFLTKQRQAWREEAAAVALSGEPGGDAPNLAAVAPRPFYPLPATASSVDLDSTAVPAAFLSPALPFDKPGRERQAPTNMDLDETLTPVPGITPTLPFREGNPASAQERLVAHEAQSPEGAGNLCGETAELRSVVPIVDLPFEAPSDLSGDSTLLSIVVPKDLRDPAAPPGKRLARFDPQTGLPLETPRWVDVSVPPSGPTKKP